MRVDAPGGLQRTVHWIGRQTAGEVTKGPVRMGQRRCELAPGGAVRRIEPAAPDQRLAMGAQDQLLMLRLDVAAGAGV